MLDLDLPKPGDKPETDWAEKLVTAIELLNSFSGGSDVAVPTRGPLAGIGKAATGKYRVVVGGTSKAAASDSPAKGFVRHLQALFGSARTVVQTFGTDGGRDAAYLGWIKQHYAGPSFVRVRGNSASTVRTFTFYGDTATLYFSRETDSTAVNILIDGNYVGQSPAAGAQAFGVKRTYTDLSTTKRHTLTVSVPSDGYVYLERLEFSYAADTGVELVDLTMGGSALWMMTNDWVATAGQAAPVPIVAGTSGLSAWLEPATDLFIGQWTVNDAGSHLGLQADFGPNWAAIVNRAEAQGQQVISVVEMGGHYSMPGSPNHANFEKLANVQRALTGRNNVTVVDFHTETIMADIVAYAARYFPGASNVDPAAGTFTGDFIHESTAPYGACLAVLCNPSGVPVPPVSTASGLRAVAVNTAPRTVVPKLRYATVNGITKNLPQVGTTYLPLTNRSVPLLSDVGIASTHQSIVTAAGTSDAFGPYKLTNFDYRGIAMTAGRVYTVTVVSAGNASVRVDKAHVLDEFGNELPYDDANNKITRVLMASGTQPVTWSFQIGSPDGAPALVLENTANVAWKVYGLWVTPSATPVIHPITAADSAITATGQVVSPGTAQYPEPVGMTLENGVWLINAAAIAAQNDGHGANGTWLVIVGNGRNSVQQLGNTVAVNSITGLTLALTGSTVKATATGTAGNYTVNFTYTATRIGSKA